MWRALFIGWIAVVLAEEASVKTDVSKRQIGRDNNAVYRVSPDQYIIQSPERETQNAAEYQSHSDLYIIRKPTAVHPTYINQAPKRSQHIQLSALQQLQLAQQQQRISEQQQSIVNQQLKATQQQISYPGLSESGPRPVYKTAPVSQSQQSAQYSDSAIVNTRAGAFERELAELVAASRAQEEKHNVEPLPQRPVITKRPPAPEQYLKEITRPTPRPVQQSAIRAGPVRYQSTNAASPPPPALYRYVYQTEQHQQIPVQHEPQYGKPHLQQYQLAQPQLRDEEVGPITQAHATAVSQALSSGFSAGSARDVSAVAPSRSTIYVSQGTLLKKLPYSGLGSISSDPDKNEGEVSKQFAIPQVRILPKNRPFTQEEFQQILQSGRYTATLVPSNNPNSPQQEYILHPAGVPRSTYTSDKQETAPYLIPQTQQSPVKRRPVYNVQQQ